MGQKDSKENMKKTEYSDLLLLDASAWIEYFNGSDKGNHVKSVLEKEDCCTCITTLAEIVNWASRENKESKPLIDTIYGLSSIIKVNEDIAVLAGRLNFERKKVNTKWGMLDSFFLATGELYGLRILTKDSDFGDLGTVEIL